MSSYHEPLPLEQRVVSIGAIRDEVDSNPSLTDEEVEAIRNATDEQIADALRANWRSVEDLFYAAHDQLQVDVIQDLTLDYEEKQGL